MIVPNTISSRTPEPTFGSHTNKKPRTFEESLQRDRIFREGELRKKFATATPSVYSQRRDDNSQMDIINDSNTSQQHRSVIITPSVSMSEHQQEHHHVLSIGRSSL